MPRTSATKDRAFIAGTMLLLAAVTFVVALHHEPWRDEADVWLLLRDGGVGTMLARTGYVGMPALWYLLVAPLPALHLPYFSMTLLNLVTAWAAVAVFLVFAPFSRLIRFLFVFSYFIAYEYSVLARPYALSLLLLFGVAAVWPHRDERPVLLGVLIALLASTTTHALVMAALLGALFLWEVIAAREWRNRRKVAAILIALAGGLASVYQLLPPPDVPKSHIFRGLQLEGPIWAVGNAFLPGLGAHVPAVFGLLMLALISFAIGRRLVPQLFLWGSIGLLALMYTFVWIAGFRHAGLMLIAVVVAMWLSAAYAPPEGPRWRWVNRALGVSLAYCVVVAMRYWVYDYGKPFSGAEEMGRFIRANGLDRYEIAAHLPTAGEAVLPYLPGKRFYYAAQHERGSYMLWDKKYNLACATRFATAVAAAELELPPGKWLLMVNEEMKDPQSYGFRLLFTNLTPPFEKRDERYWLYAPLNWSGPPLPEVR